MSAGRAWSRCRSNKTLKVSSRRRRYPWSIDGRDRIGSWGAGMSLRSWEECMKRNRLFVVVFAFGVASTSVVGLMSHRASARTLTPSMGQRQAPANGEENCFQFNLATGAVTNTCAFTRTWMVPLPEDFLNSKNLFFTSRATAGGAFCQLHANNRFGTALTVSPPVTIPVTSNYTAQLTGNVGPADVLFFVCTMN